MDKDIKVNIDNINMLQRNIEIKGSELVNVINLIIKETKDMQKIYDSPTATIFREKFCDYLQNRIDYINNNYVELSNVLESIKSVYLDEISKTSKMVGE